MILPPWGRRVEDPADNAVDAVERETALARKRHRVARGEAEGAGRRVALKAADPEQRRIAKGQRHDRGGQFLFVPVLVQAHPRGRIVEVDQAGLGRGRVRGNRREGGEELRRHRRPRTPGLRVRRLVTISALVRDPAERAAIAHAYRKRLARARHARAKWGRKLKDRQHLVPQRFLSGAVEKTGEIIHSRGYRDGSVRRQSRSSRSPSLGAGRGV